MLVHCIEKLYSNLCKDVFVLVEGLPDYYENAATTAYLPYVTWKKYTTPEAQIPHL